jgi:hypothetical protein
MCNADADLHVISSGAAESGFGKFRAIPGNIRGRFGCCSAHAPYLRQINVFPAGRHYIASRRCRKMFRINSAHFSGKSGQRYDFYAYPIDQPLQTVGAVYVITRRYKNSRGGVSHHVIYVGDTHDLSTMLAKHPRRDCFLRRKANCIGAHVDEDQNSRTAKRDDLIQQLDPACNR